MLSCWVFEDWNLLCPKIHIAEVWLSYQTGKCIKFYGCKFYTCPLCIGLLIFLLLFFSFLFFGCCIDLVMGCRDASLACLVCQLIQGYRLKVVKVVQHPFSCRSPHLLAQFMLYVHSILVKQCPQEMRVWIPVGITPESLLMCIKCLNPASHLRLFLQVMFQVRLKCCIFALQLGLS